MKLELLHQDEMNLLEGHMADIIAAVPKYAKQACLVLCNDLLFSFYSADKEMAIIQREAEALSRDLCSANAQASLLTQTSSSPFASPNRIPTAFIGVQCFLKKC